MYEESIIVKKKRQNGCVEDYDDILTELQKTNFQEKSKLVLME